MLKKLKKFQLILYQEKLSLIGGSKINLVPAKSSQTINDKVKKQKKDKKEMKKRSLNTKDNFKIQIGND